MGLCPFHNEKTPSFSVNDDNGFFHCFGCGASGNVFKFLMMTESLTFPEAVRKVAERYGIEVRDENAVVSPQRSGFYEANASAARYFHRFLLESEHGRPALEYLRARGLGDESIETFQVGAAPLSGAGLVRWLAREGIDLGSAHKLGLIVERGGRPVDRFRNRVMFPIRDVQGRVIGFGGRQLGEGDGPKYLNSPESEVYRKSRALYGLYEGRDALRSEDVAILVEGYMDVIAVRQAGVANVVATCGTALTADQARIIRRMAADAVALFDGDGAGGRAAARSFPIFIEAGIWPKAASLPDGDDPDTFVRQHGVDALRARIASAKPLAEPYVRHVVDNSGGGSAGRARAGAELASLLRKVQDPYQYDELVRKAAIWSEISEAVLRREGLPRPQADAPAAPRRRRGGAPGPEELLITVMLADTNTVAVVDQTGIINSMDAGVWKDAADAMIERVRTAGAMDPAAIIEGLPEEYRDRVAARLGEDAYAEAALRDRVLDDCVRSIERKARRRHNQAMLSELRKREDLGVDLAPAEELANWRPRSSSDA